MMKSYRGIIRGWIGLEDRIDIWLAWKEGVDSSFFGVRRYLNL